MSNVPEIEAAVRQLSPQELAQFREWFAKLTRRSGTGRSNATPASGRLDGLAGEALNDLRAGRCKDL